jgi:hypothetical protein
MMKEDNPIFIHSLFRSGSTYLVEVFRRSPANYWCYQEPLHEIFLSQDLSKDFLLQEDNKKASYLRHPALSRPYFYEFSFVVNEIKRLFRKSFPYDLYFLSKLDDCIELKAYLNLLLQNAPATPVLQCCRSIGRMEALKQEVGGIHIFLWRNPWDQWWSYKTDFYFDRANILIANALTAPDFIKRLRFDINLPEFHSDNLYDEILFAEAHRLTSDASYMLFYALWCHAFIVAKPLCDLDINIDMLAVSMEYRDSIVKRLTELGISNLDFSDCKVPISTHSTDDKAFFDSIEERIHGLLQDSGISSKQIDEMLTMRHSHTVSFSDEHFLQSLMITASRSTKLTRRYETELANLVSRWNSAIEALQRAEAAARQASERAVAAEARADQAEANTREAQAHAEQAQARAHEAEQRLAALYNSISWRITAPLRTPPVRFVYRQIIHIKEQGFIGRVKFVSGNLLKIGEAKAVHFIEDHPVPYNTALKWMHRLGLYALARAFYRRVTRHNSDAPFTCPPPVTNIESEALSPRAHEIYSQLKNGLDTEKKRDSGIGCI